MSQSGAPGETVKRTKNQACMEVRVELEFTDMAIKEQAPQWDQNGLALLQKLLQDNLQITTDDLNKMAEQANLSDIVKVLDVTVRATR